MSAPLLRSAALAALVLLGGLSCQEDLTAPADCPQLCPGGQQEIFEVVLPAVPGVDTSYTGYILPPAAASLLASNGLNGSVERTLVRFVGRPDQLTVEGTARSYTVDSVAISFTLLARDTLATGLALSLYRMPATIDSTTTFADVEPLLTEANRITTVPVADTLEAGQPVRVLLKGADLARVAIPDADDGVLAVAAVLEAPQPTGVRLGALASGRAPQFVSFVTVPEASTSAQKQTITRVPSFNASVSSVSPAVDPALLTVGGLPASRAFLRFELPAFIRDSARLVRATLELVPAEPITGLRGDPAQLQAYGVRSDVGPKSPLCVVNSRCGDIVVARIASGELPTTGSLATVELDVNGVVRAWQGANPAPSALFLALNPEGGSFTRPVFGSTRTPAALPQLRINYVRQFPFERP